ncbi:MAG: PilN domain-containing protein [Cyanobacterium sp. T60_A2020_053]|nr:PilN domain-containing protein [Cyanobacterium sp. T60_A2020_053]
MYNIDVNFLKDRKLDGQTQTTKTASFKKKETPFSERVPLLIGSGVAVAFIAMVGGGLVLLNNQKTGWEAEIAQLDTEIQQLQGQNTRITEIEQQIQGVNQQINSLVSVFDNIKPWSALLEEIAAVTPANVQIQSLTQSGATGLTISGFANSYDDVNDFVLTLKSSPLLNAEATRLTSTSLGANPANVIRSRAEIPTAEGEPAPSTVADTAPVDESINVTLNEGATFNITTELAPVPSTEVVNLLAERGAIGLVSRINALNRLGALDLEPITQEAQPTE